ncbi:MAG: cobyrinate a,c-diamide synthase [Eubacteriales bacterium]|nr:cobyrinate a,c-diamide synthase [Eubacteriales bacterium]
MKINRFMIAAPASGSGKTLLTCGVLRLLKRKGYRTVSFKCGPDYIDPMFHTKVLGTPSRNLDTFFAEPEGVRALLAKNAADVDIAVMEGVMGYFDGLGLDSSRAGASDLAETTDTPVFLIIPAKGTSRSVLPMVKGFLDFQKKACIKGIILNRVSPMLYPRMKEMIEKEIDVPVVGYMPVITDCALESRHLGLVMPDEIEELHDKLDRLADVLEKSLDLEQMIAIAGEAPEIKEDSYLSAFHKKTHTSKVRIGLADDEAFCFFYRDNLDLLRELGAELVPFSPIHDEQLPEDLDGLWLHGGYPELYGRELSENRSMRDAVHAAITGGMPVLAECGGFMYLHKELKDAEGKQWPMVGIFPENVWYTGRLVRFGYITLTEGSFFGKTLGDMRAHEFHYFDSEDPGDAFLAKKPTGNRSWRAVRSSDTMYAGYPHMYFYANPEMAPAFLDACASYQRKRK